MFKILKNTLVRNLTEPTETRKTKDLISWFFKERQSLILQMCIPSSDLLDIHENTEDILIHAVKRYKNVKKYKTHRILPDDGIVQFW